jgi:hypothetical protein
MMNLDLIGRVNNTKLAHSRALYPLFEAVVNSLHAIEESRNPAGNIDIYVQREQGLAGLEMNDYDLSPILNFCIEDNGIGFTDENYQSFDTADSTFKASKGAKGIGRFLWLKAFNKVHIESVFKKNGEFYERSFEFRLSKDGVEKKKCDKTDKKDCKTIVTLMTFGKGYQDHCPKSIAAIGNRIIEHCLVSFLSNSCPQITIRDDKDAVNLNEVFREKVISQANTVLLECKGQAFKLLNLKLFFGDDRKHRLHFCANEREVTSEVLSARIADLNRKITDEQNRPFTYSGYVFGKFLDDTVNPERTDFVLSESNGIDFPDEITKDDLMKHALAGAKVYLGKYLKSIREEKQAHIERYIQNKAPQYRPILKYRPEAIENIPPGLSDEKLDLELYRIDSVLSLELKERSNKLLGKKIKEIKDYEEYNKEYKEVVEQVNDFSKSKLANYIVHRKLILNLLENNLEEKADGKYQLEESIHEIIFPLRSTSDEVDYERQNLWIIDEKLSYHKYLASDKRVDKLEVVAADGKDRPDLLIFNSPFAFVEGKAPFSSIIIIEFKRPARNDYDEDDDNPILQVYRYVRKIQAGKMNDRAGKLITVPKSIPYYSYIICDLTTKIRNFAEEAGFTIAPDGSGYFGYNQNLLTYTEVISYQKLVTDAQQRNRVLFDKLHLPT